MNILLKLVIFSTLAVLLLAFAPPQSKGCDFKYNILTIQWLENFCAGGKRKCPGYKAGVSKGKHLWDTYI